MIARVAPRRSGLTLTEILIAILIMGIGLISLATLFPLGLIRLRETARYVRAGLTFETAADDFDARALLFKPSFRNSWYGPRDPFVQDALSNGSYNTANAAGMGVLASGNPFLPNNNLNLSSGLPFCYDPLWRALTGIAPVNNLTGNGLYDPTLDFAAGYVNGFDEARFGAGVFGNTSYPYLRADPDMGTPSAYGLQRLTNFIPWSNNLLTPRYSFTYHNNVLAAAIVQPIDVAGDVFTSIDDLVFNPIGASGTATPLSSGTSPPSSVLPELYGQTTTQFGMVQADYRYTWFFTGRQSDAGGNGTQFVGEIVVCDGRPFAFEPLPGNGPNAPAGETVVEAVFGVSSDRTVVLRWKATTPDPLVRVGGWIADVTYERNVATYTSRVGATGTLARCYWYQVARLVSPQADPDTTNFSGYRQMVVTLNSPVRAATTLDANGLPVHVNVALIMPSVINVFPRSFEVH